MSCFTTANDDNDDANQDNQVPAIILVDSSGSTTSGAYMQSRHIFHRFQKVVTSLPHDKFRFVFWSSNKNNVVKIPYVVDRAKVSQTFAVVEPSINRSCLTKPSLGFQAIDKKLWIDGEKPTHVYLLTDGAIGYSNIPDPELVEWKRELANEVTALLAGNSNIQLHIVCVENKYVDFSTSEDTKIVGGDVFEVLSKNGLTNRLADFVSYTPNHDETGYMHVQNAVVPKGFAPFGARAFSMTKTNQFMEFLVEEITAAKDDQDALIAILQKLVGTLAVLTKDKAAWNSRHIVGAFCNVFEDSVLDTALVNYMLGDIVEKEQRGQGMILGEYRAMLSNLYKQATQLLTTNTKNAMGLGGDPDGLCVSMLFSDCIFVGSHNSMTETLTLRGTRFPQSAIVVNDVVIPAFPAKSLQDLSHMNQQCIRQFVRSAQHVQTGHRLGDDIHMYLMAGQMLRARLAMNNECNNTIAIDAYRVLTTIMLGKKRAQTDITELAHFEQGNLPTPNHAAIQQFHEYMKVVASELLGTTTTASISPMSLWYGMCLALGNKTLSDAQRIHCLEDLRKDGIEPANVLNAISAIKTAARVGVHRLPQTQLDYTCLVTLNSTAETGGWRFKVHTTASGHKCRPSSVMSEEGMNSMFENGNDVGSSCLCPHCYRRITRQDMEKAKPLQTPEPVLSTTVFEPGTVSPFVGAEAEASAATLQNKYKAARGGRGRGRENNNGKQKMGSSSSRSSTFGSNATASSSANCSSNTVIVAWDGTVGAGKTTIAALVQAALEQDDDNDAAAGGGWRVFNEGTDKYCVQGMQTRQAAGKVTQVFEEARALAGTGRRVCVIVDTCGQAKTSARDVFGVNFEGATFLKMTPNFWKGESKPEEYMAWSLRNVLGREAHTSDSKFYLNPVTAGAEVCVNVCAKKLQVMLSGRKAPVITKNLGKAQILKDIGPLADAYQTLIDEKHPLDDEVARIVAAIVVKRA